jgi:hypothetical protein
MDEITCRCGDDKIFAKGKAICPEEDKAKTRAVVIRILRKYASFARNANRT